MTDIEKGGEVPNYPEMPDLIAKELENDSVGQKKVRGLWKRCY
jgi:hypothetical protein